MSSYVSSKILDINRKYPKTFLFLKRILQMTISWARFFYFLAGIEGFLKHINISGIDQDAMLILFGHYGFPGSTCSSYLPYLSTLSWLCQIPNPLRSGRGVNSGADNSCHKSILINSLVISWRVSYMKCDRCGRAMAYEQFCGDQDRFWGWRCIFCGEIVDDVILENRRWLKTGVVPDNKKD